MLRSEGSRGHFENLSMNSVRKQIPTMGRPGHLDTVAPQQLDDRSFLLKSFFTRFRWLILLEHHRD